jgi:hypothetical protein
MQAMVDDLRVSNVLHAIELNRDDGLDQQVQAACSCYRQREESTASQVARADFGLDIQQPNSDLDVPLWQCQCSIGSRAAQAKESA